ncbi:heavy-metal-associated domain-containing protein [Janibacter sp. Soil728]|nr:heavy metal-associated domain-containing protein [Janibacter sp. Soil728]
MSTTNEYRVSGMTCGHCEAGTLIVTGDGIDDAAVLTAVTDAGYQASRA